MSKPIIYLSGKMSGLPGFNYRAFNKEAKRLRKLGYAVLNPAENFGGKSNHPDGRKAYIRLDIGNVLKANCLAVFDNWHDSRGATLEIEIARQLDYPVYQTQQIIFYDPLLHFVYMKDWLLPEHIETTETILQEAQRLVYGDRQAAYSHPSDDYSRASRMQEPVIEKALKRANPDFYLPRPGWLHAEDSALLMVLIKVARESHKHKRDNLTDMAGYSAVIDRIHRHNEGLE